MKVKVTIPSQKVVSDQNGEGHAVASHTTEEREIEKREDVQFTTAVNNMNDFEGKILVNPNHATLVEFID